MSICAGYLSGPLPQDPQSIREVIENFSVLKKSDTGSQEVRIINTKFGHQLCKYDHNTPAQPYMAQDSKGNVLMILGFIRGEIQGEAPIQHSLLHVVTEKGASALEGLEGQFVGIFVEGRSGTVHIVNDRFASRPFYIARTNTGTFYASNLAFVVKLAAISPTPDCLGWLQIFRFSHTLDKTTNIVGVQRLRPGTHLTITPESFTERQYWKLQHYPDDRLQAESFADEVFETFQESAAWRAKRSPRGIIALSGGLDSRLVAACIPKDLDFTAFTFVNSVESENTPDVLAASQVAARLGLRHEIKRIEVGTYSRSADAVVRLTDGLVPLHHPSKTMQYIGRLGNDCAYLLGGGPGDVLAGSYVPDEAYLDPNRSVELVNDYCAGSGLSAPFLSRVFGDDVLSEFLPKLDNSLLESFSDVTGSTAAHRITAWAMRIRQPAFTFTTPFHNHPQFEEGTAHLGYRYSDLMLRLPGDWLLYRNFYSYMIYRCLPQLRDVIYANSGKLLTGQLREFDMHAVKPLDFKTRFKSQVKKLPLVQTIRNLLPMELSLHPHYSFDYSILRHDDLLLRDTEDMLDLPAVSALIDQRKCKTFVQKFRQGRIQTTSGGDAALLGCLATLCISVKNSQI